MLPFVALTVAAAVLVAGTWSIRRSLRVGPGTGPGRSRLRAAGLTCWTALLVLIMAAPTLYAQFTGRHGTWWNYTDTAPEVVLAIMIIGLVAAVVCTVRLLIMVRRFLVDQD
ncbi:hypothetical protein [Microlunatus parietis]|uniref:Drug/metabolite transporter (DMT)-like permease n=1 Tax=Microlunatus parietis TaxID=682979 RepID=A0A7Y9I569_9ACTN|nr:hypothetical protein [Microlunatus parietis]NYE70221.1 drug/metabolite transporter (DMT)-like permease [Microlunatus parietis]